MNPALGRCLLWLVPAAHAAGGTPGPFPPAAGQAGSDAIAAGDPRFRGWATSVVRFDRGRTILADAAAPLVNYGLGSSALGPSDLTNLQEQPEIGAAGPFPVVSLGDAGAITLGFAVPIADGPGPDFAVFENSFSATFLELAFIEVSSDGTHFVRFPAVSLTATATQVTLGTVGGLDATSLHNVAGKYQGGFGTPFDLAELSAETALDRRAVTHVRVVDVVGSVDPVFGTRDSENHLVNDPYPTDYETGGFDLDAVGVIHQAIVSYAAWKAAVAWGASDSSPAADPEGDGCPNTLEYALDTDPLQPNAPPTVTLAVTGGRWIATLPHCRPATTDLICGAETSEDLSLWISHAGTAPVDLGPAGLAPQRFCRLHVHLTGNP